MSYIPSAFSLIVTILLIHSHFYSIIRLGVYGLLPIHRLIIQGLRNAWSLISSGNVSLLLLISLGFSD
jgi:hypothetical protein